jgi:glycosyltransferase involved in cell wall biosynthesis
MRYAWDLRETYLVSAGAHRGMRRFVADGILDRLRRWDAATSTGVDRFIAISETIRERIARCYDRCASVIYPPVDVDFFAPAAVVRAKGTYVTASHWVPYKRLDLIVDAFRALPGRQLIVAGDGPGLRDARVAAPSNVDFTGEISRHRLRDLLRGAAGFIFAAEEDFGITPLEAQACGTPVIAFGRGAARETIRGLDTDAPTGVFFEAQTAASLRSAVAAFEASSDRISADACRANAERFAADLFRRRFAEEIAAALADFQMKLASMPC